MTLYLNLYHISWDEAGCEDTAASRSSHLFTALTLLSGSSQFLKEANVSGRRDAVEEEECLRTCKELFAVGIVILKLANDLRDAQHKSQRYWWKGDD